MFRAKLETAKRNLGHYIRACRPWGRKSRSCAGPIFILVPHIIHLYNIEKLLISVLFFVTPFYCIFRNQNTIIPSYKAGCLNVQSVNYLFRILKLYNLEFATQSHPPLDRMHPQYIYVQCADHCPKSVLLKCNLQRCLLANEKND